MQRSWFIFFIMLVLAIGGYCCWQFYQNNRELKELGVAEFELNNCPAVMDEAAIKSVKMYQQLQKAVMQGNLRVIQRNAKALSIYLSKINPEASAAAQKLALANNKPSAQNEFQKFDQLLDPKSRKPNPNILILP